jgi:hypothetical protein
MSKTVTTDTVVKGLMSKTVTTDIAVKGLMSKTVTTGHLVITYMHEYIYMLIENLGQSCHYIHA